MDGELVDGNDGACPEHATMLAGAHAACLDTASLERWGPARTLAAVVTRRLHPSDSVLQIEARDRTKEGPRNTTAPFDAVIVYAWGMGGGSAWLDAVRQNVRPEQLANSVTVMVLFDNDDGNDVPETHQQKQLRRIDRLEEDLALGSELSSWPAAGLSLVEAVSTEEAAVLVLRWERWEARQRRGGEGPLPALEVVRSVATRNGTRQHVERLLVHEGGFI